MIPPRRKYMTHSYYPRRRRPKRRLRNVRSTCDQVARPAPRQRRGRARARAGRRDPRRHRGRGGHDRRRAAVVALQQFLRGRTTEDLAQATGLTHSGAVRLVDRLVEGGLVERRPGHDGRSLAIVLTASGRALSQKITAARATVASALEGLRIEERRALLPVVESLIATVTQQRLDARARGDEPAGWLCRLCDFGACGRPQGDCPAANAARSNGNGRMRLQISGVDRTSISHSRHVPGVRGTTRAILDAC